MSPDRVHSKSVLFRVSFSPYNLKFSLKILPSHHYPFLNGNFSAVRSQEPHMKRNKRQKTSNFSLLGNSKCLQFFLKNKIDVITLWKSVVKGS